MEALSGVDLQRNGRRLGLRTNCDGQVWVKFLGRYYRFEPGSIRTADGRDAELHHGSVLAGYLLKNGTGHPSLNFVPLGRLTGMVAGRTSYSKGVLERRLADAAGRSMEYFRRAIRKLDGKPGGEVGNGGESWIIYLLPKIPIQLIVYEEDDEFPLDIRILFDLTAPAFLEFEFLAVLASIFVTDLIELIPRY